MIGGSSCDSCCVIAVALHFVRAIFTLGDAVALPVSNDALLAISAAPFIVLADDWSFALTVLLGRAILVPDLTVAAGAFAAGIAPRRAADPAAAVDDRPAVATVVGRGALC